MGYVVRSGGEMKTGWVIAEDYSSSWLILLKQLGEREEKFIVSPNLIPDFLRCLERANAEGDDGGQCEIYGVGKGEDVRKNEKANCGLHRAGWKCLRERLRGVEDDRARTRR